MKSVLLLLLLVAFAGCRESKTVKLSLVLDRKAFQDPDQDVRSMKRRLVKAGAKDLAIRRAGDTAHLEFAPPLEGSWNWVDLLTRPGTISTTELASVRRFPLFLPTLHLRLGRSVDLLPDLPAGEEPPWPSAALVPPARRAEVDMALLDPEFARILGPRTRPVWGRRPGSVVVDGIRREGAELFLLPNPPRGGWLVDDAFDSATWVPGPDTGRDGIELHLTLPGRTAYREMTQEMMGASVAIVVDGQLLEVEKVGLPVVSDRFWIGGCGSECRMLAAVLHGGAMHGSWSSARR